MDTSQGKHWVLWTIIAVLVVGTVSVAWQYIRSSPAAPQDAQASPTVDSHKTVIMYAVHWSDYQVKGVFDQDGKLKFKGLQQYLDEYNASHPDVQVKQTYIDFSKYPDTLKLFHDADAAPDIYQIYSTWGVSLARAGVFAIPPPDVLADVKANYTSTAGVTIDGKIWGIPTEVDDYVLVYNKQLFAAAGITQPPTTWNQLVADAVKLTKHDTKGIITQYGIALTPKDFVADAYLSLLLTNGGRYLSSDLKSCALNSSAGVAALDAMTSLFKKGATDLNAAVSDFSAGKVGMVIMAPWQKNGLVAAFGSRFDNVVGIAPIPYMKKPASLQYSWFMGVMAKSKHQQEAWDFLKWFTSDIQPATGTTRYGDLLAQTIGAIPSRKSDIIGDAQYLAGDPFKKVFIDQLPNSIPEPNVADAATLKGDLTDEIMKAWAGSETSQQALANACSSINATLHVQGN